jgi:hypothetical protein
MVAEKIWTGFTERRGQETITFADDLEPLPYVSTGIAVLGDRTVVWITRWDHRTEMHVLDSSLHACQTVILPDMKIRDIAPSADGESIIAPSWAGGEENLVYRIRVSGMAGSSQRESNLKERRKQR